MFVSILIASKSITMYIDVRNHARPHIGRLSGVDFSEMDNCLNELNGMGNILGNIREQQFGCLGLIYIIQAWKVSNEKL